MYFIEAIAELDQIYTSSKKDLNEGRSMPYALIVLLNGEWKVYKGLDSNLTDNELADFLSNKTEYSDAKVIPSSDIQKYVQKKSLLKEESWMSRAVLIDELKSLGYAYNFDKYSDRQLYSILEKTKAKIEANKALAELESEDLAVKPTCSECGSLLADSGICPKCYDGVDNLDEGIFDTDFNQSSWVTASGASIAQSAPQTTQSTSTSTSNIVTIVNDRGRLRAQADDGIHGQAWTAFPNSLRNQVGQQYEVDALVWTGKNYRVSGNITPITAKSNLNNNTQTNVNSLYDIYSDYSDIFDNVNEAMYMARKITYYLVDNPTDAEKFARTASNSGYDAYELMIIDDLIADTLEAGNYHIEMDDYYHGKLPIHISAYLSSQAKAKLDTLFNTYKNNDKLLDQLYFFAVNGLAQEI